jgi:hypothetical protein
MREVSADKAYSSKANPPAVEAVGAVPFIVFRDAPTDRVLNPDTPAPGPGASAWERTHHQFAYNRDAFLAHYHARSNVETNLLHDQAQVRRSP